MVADAFGGDGVLFIAVGGRQVRHGVVAAKLIRLFCHRDLSLRFKDEEQNPESGNVADIILSES